LLHLVYNHLAVPDLCIQLSWAEVSAVLGGGAPDMCGRCCVTAPAGGGQPALGLRSTQGYKPRSDSRRKRDISRKIRLRAQRADGNPRHDTSWMINLSRNMINVREILRKWRAIPTEDATKAEIPTSQRHQMEACSGSATVHLWVH
jgi:hypothetical protein